MRSLIISIILCTTRKEKVLPIKPRQIVTHILISEMLKYDQIVRLRIYKMWFIIVIDKQKLFIHLFLMH